MIESIPQWDKDIFYAFNGTRSPFLDTVMPVFSYTWLLWLLCLIAFALWGGIIYRRTKNFRTLLPVLFGMILILSTAGVNDLVTCAVKEEIGRLRPYQKLPYAYFQRDNAWLQNTREFKPWKHKADSFFSGHASHSMAVAVTAATLCPSLSPVIYAMPLVVGYSRIYLGKHYPSDVLCGWIAGAAVALFARRLTRRLREKLGLPAGKRYPEGETIKRFSACRAKKAAGSE